MRTTFGLFEGATHLSIPCSENTHSRCGDGQVRAVQGPLQFLDATAEHPGWLIDEPLEIRELMPAKVAALAAFKCSRLHDPLVEFWKKNRARIRSIAVVATAVAVLRFRVSRNTHAE